MRFVKGLYIHPARIMTAGILLLEDELLSVKKQDLHKIQCSGIGNINFLDLKEAEFLTLNTVVGPE